MSASETKDALTIDVEPLQERLQAGDPITVLDVRPADERAEWSIPGSVYVDAYDALKRNDPDALAGVDRSGRDPRPRGRRQPLRHLSRSDDETFERNETRDLTMKPPEA
jgi:rhodanese-related sulfurtransferase